MFYFLSCSIFSNSSSCKLLERAGGAVGTAPDGRRADVGLRQARGGIGEGPEGRGEGHEGRLPGLAALDERTLLLTAKGVRTRGRVGRVEPPRHG